MNRASDHRNFVELRGLLSTRFNESELRTLCFDLGVDYDGLSGGGTADKARELVAYYERRDRVPELVKAIQISRPDVLPPSLRLRVRELIRKINPEALRLMDTGQSAIHVMVSVPNLLALQQLETEIGFANLLRVVPTGAVIAGGFGNRIGDALNDINEGGPLQGYLFRPLPELLEPDGEAAGRN